MNNLKPVGEICLPRKQKGREGKIPYLEIGDIDVDSKKYLLKDKPSVAGCSIAQKNDLVISRVRPTRGAVSIIDEENLIVSNAFTVLSTKEFALPKYVFYNLAFNKNFFSYLEKLQKGSSYPSCREEDILNFRISLPDLKTQQKIASILEQADAARQKRKQANQLTEQFLQSAFLEMFGDPVRNEKEWEVKPLEYFGKWKSGGTPSRSNDDFFDGNIPWYTSGELNQMYIGESIEHISDEAINKSAAKLLEPNTLLLGMYDTAALKSSITTIPCSCNQAIAYSKLENKKINIIYLYFAIQVGREFFRSQQRGVRQKNLNLDMIKNLAVPFPPLPLQQKFASLVEQVEHLRVKQRESARELENLFNSLMQRYFGN